MYGLETLYLNDSLIKRLDACHMRGIRHILGIEHAYWSRKSNLEILEKANNILYNKENVTNTWANFMIPNNDKNRHIRLVSEILEDKKIKLLGHIMRCEEKVFIIEMLFK